MIFSFRCCCCEKQIAFVKMSDSDEILFDDIYELHEVIGEIIVVAVAVVVVVAVGVVVVVVNLDEKLLVLILLLLLIVACDTSAIC